MHFKIDKVFLLFLLITCCSALAQDRNYQKLSPEKQYKLVELMIARHSFHQAEELLKKLSESDAKNTKYIFALGQVNLKLRDYKHAKTNFDKLSELDKAGGLGGYYYLGITNFHLGIYDQAIVNFETFLKASYKANVFKTQKEDANLKIKACREAIVLVDNQFEYAEITNLGSNINSAYSDFAPSLKDSSSLLFSSIRADTLLKYDFGEAHFHHLELFEANKDEYGNWGLPKSLDRLNKVGFNTANGNFNLDKRKFYFTRCKNNLKHKSICHIYVSDVKDNAFQQPYKLSDKINISEVTSTQPAVSRTAIDGKLYDILYFSSDRKGGMGGLDLYYAILDNSGKVKSLGNLGKSINTAGDEITPFYYVENKELFFSSDYHLGIGGFDVFRSSGAIADWTKPQNIGVPFNSSYDDTYFSKIPNSKDAFIVSNREGGQTLQSTCCEDIYLIKFAEQAKITVVAFDENLKKIASNSIKLTLSMNENETIKPITDSLATEYYLKPKNKFKFSATYKTDSLLAHIISFDKDRIEVKQMSDTLKNRITVHESKNDQHLINLYFKRSTGNDSLVRKKEALLEESAISLKSEYKVVSKNKKKSDTTNLKATDFDSLTFTFYFGYKELDFIRTQENNLDYLVAIIKKSPNVAIAIEAHSDNVGNQEYNLFLSQTRADRIKEYLVTHGIRSNIIVSKGFGEIFPVAKNNFDTGEDNAEGRAYNRRALIKIVKNSKAK